MKDLLFRFDEPSRCGLVDVSEGCIECSLPPVDMEEIPVLLAMLCSAVPFNDGKKKGMVGKGPVCSLPLLLLLMAP